MEFPRIRPDGANYVRPRDGEAMDITPPGFCWWRAAERGVCQYRLVIRRDDAEQYASPLTPDPIDVPNVVFPSGAYTWHVEAVTDTGRVGAVSEALAEMSLAFARRAYARPDFVGWHWCGWMDGWKTIPGKEMRQHSGLQDPFGNRYQPMVAALSSFSDEMYDVAEA